MRDIKFRVWNPNINTMIEPFDLITFAGNFDGGFSTWGYVSLESNEFLMPSTNEKGWKDLIFMEYTGLQDKSGKEIYEGDILEAVDEHEEDCTCDHCFNVRIGERVIVVWLDGGFRLYPADEYNEFGKREEQLAGTCNWCSLVSESMMSPNHEIPCGYFFKIIGNVYENANLLDKLK